jgi:hypothetical protein
MENDCETTVTPNRNTIGGSNIKLKMETYNAKEN